MERKLFDMSEPEHPVTLAGVVVTAVHCIRVARIARGGTCWFQPWNFLVSHPSSTGVLLVFLYR